MRYHSEPPEISVQVFGEIYICNHPVYNQCTLFKEGNIGLAVIQQYYNPRTKHTWWSNIEGWIANDLYLHPLFRTRFSEFAGPPKNDIYPTITVRQFMWALKMKPLKREPWETTFDHKDI